MPLSPVIAAKKARPSDGGSDEVCNLYLIFCDVISEIAVIHLLLCTKFFIYVVICQYNLNVDWSENLPC